MMLSPPLGLARVGVQSRSRWIPSLSTESDFVLDDPNERLRIVAKVVGSGAVMNDGFGTAEISWRLVATCKLILSNRRLVILCPGWRHAAGSDRNFELLEASRTASELKAAGGRRGDVAALQVWNEWISRVVYKPQVTARSWSGKDKVKRGAELSIHTSIEPGILSIKFRPSLDDDGKNFVGSLLNDLISSGEQKAQRVADCEAALREVETPYGFDLKLDGASS